MLKHPQLLIPELGKGRSFSELSTAFDLVKRLDLTGMKGGSLGALIAELWKERATKTLIVVQNADCATQLHKDIAFHHGMKSEVLLYQSFNLGPYDELVPERRSSMQRTGVLFNLATDSNWKFIVVSADALLRKIIPRSTFEELCIPLKVGDLVDRDIFIKTLERGGYNRASLVEEQGTYAVRGALIDVYPPYLKLPIRFELMGNQIDSIRFFNPNDQSTESRTNEAWIHPCRLTVTPVNEEEQKLAAQRIRAICDEVDQPTGRTDLLIDDLLSGRLFVGAEAYLPALNETLGSLLDYLPKEFEICIDDPAAVRMTWQKSTTLCSVDLTRRLERKEPAFPLLRHLISSDSIEKEILTHRLVVSHPLLLTSKDENEFEQMTDPLDVSSNSTEDLHERLRNLVPTGDTIDLIAPLTTYLQSLEDSGYRILLTAHTTGQAERLTSMLQSRGLDIKLTDHKTLSNQPGVSVTVGDMARGFILPRVGLAWISEEEIFGRRSRRSPGPSRSKTSLDDLRHLTLGDLVVHKEHGVGKYEGLVRKDIGNSKVDFLLITYKDNDKLYLPVYRLNQVQKYRITGEGQGRLDKLGGQTFSKVKAKARKEAMEMAARLLEIYARREISTRPPITETDDLYREFEASFPFEETPDQAKAIDDVMADFAREHPMDRLICGDVGFGKTEVAMRAAFQTAMNGRQIAVLVPTTVLAQQHYQSFSKRFKAYPINIEMISRFRTPSQNAKVILGIKEGLVDIVIGTHRLLSKDVHFKRLGLLVIDEEHRFGVTHKERIRSLKASVDTMVLTATPIPRTLHMAFSGMRDLSLISTSPIDRRPIKTMICHDDPGLLKDAIERELARDGQVYFLHNRVKDIERVADRLRKLVPKARLAVGHGQMKEAQLEQVMLDFVAGRYDILVCTTIIESGLDIPRANTIIIDRADTLGLAQLYQLRGRVGRSHVQAYAYLMVPPLASIGSDARERVEALTRYTELGSGFSIATLDLEIRGAGNLLGAEQAGDIVGVGFEMYCDLLAEAAAELNGEERLVDIDPEMTFEEPGFLPEEYISDVGQRLQYYKRLASAKAEEEVETTASEMIDRFGPLPKDTEKLVEGMVAKSICRSLAVAGLEASSKRITIHLSPETKVNPDVVLSLIRKGNGSIKLTPDLKIVINLSQQAIGGAVDAIRILRRLNDYEIKSGDFKEEILSRS